MLGRFTVILHYDGDNGDGSQPLNFHHGIVVSSKSAGPAGPPSVSFEDPQAILLAIGPRARLILTPADLNDLESNA